MDRKLHFVTLGCPKNRVDSEIMLGHLARDGFEVAEDPENADVLVVNTCGFIEDAKKESIDVILDLARIKAGRPHAKLVVTGCLVQRYARELAEEIPEVDVYLGNGAYDEIAAALDASSSQTTVSVRPPNFLHSATQPRLNSFLPHSAYVKISEGCDQRCSFCIIPQLRGTQRSRSIEDIRTEVQALAERGVVEVNLIAQDLTGYGYDQSPRVHLADLLQVLSSVEGLAWIRLHYLYPRHLPVRFFEMLAHPRIAPYVDMPLQHASDPILRRMNRGKGRDFVDRMLDRLRSARPDAAIRTSFIVGFPGETERDFQELCDFARDQDFDHVGVFKYSHEEGTTSYDLDLQVPEADKEARYAHLMAQLQEQSRARLLRFQDRRLEVLVDGVSSETELLLEARAPWQAPEVDGTIYINDGEARAGDRVEVEITETFDYDMVGHVTRMIQPAPPRPNHARLEARGAARSRGAVRLPVLP
ncbi:MAG: 30S ribosomal protein S12 methylthiotransferase RimO [Myxococcota bacterium]